MTERGDTRPGRLAYTIGCTAQYERWRDTTLFKDVGGSVWPDLSTVLEYFLAIRGAVTLTSSGRMVKAGVYAIELEGSWSSSTEAVAGQTWSSLTRPAQVVATVCSHLNDAGRLMGREMRLSFEREEVEMEEPKQVIVLRTDLKMPPGKAAAQAAHASLEAFLSGAVVGSGNDAGPHAGCGQLQMNLRAQDATWRGGSHTKIVLGVDGEAAMLALLEQARAAGLRHALITDEGRTVFGESTVTALAIGPEPCAAVDAVTGHLKLYR